MCGAFRSSGSGATSPRAVCGGLGVPERSVAQGDTQNVLPAGPGWAVQVLLRNAMAEGPQLWSPRSGYGSAHLSSNPAQFSLFLLPLLKPFSQVTFCQYLICLLCSYLAYLSACLSQYSLVSGAGRGCGTQVSFPVAGKLGWY